MKVALSSRRSTNPVHQKPPDGQIDDLAWAAITALAKIAAASGHPIGVPAASSAGTRGGSSAGIVAIVVGVVMATSVALLIVRRRRAAGRGFS